MAKRSTKTKPSTKAKPQRTPAEEAQQRVIRRERAAQIRAEERRIGPGPTERAEQDQERREQRQRQVTDRAGQAGEIAAKPFRATSRVLVVEWLVCLIVIASKPYDKAAQQGQPASEGTIPQLISVSIAFALLAALGAAGVRQQRISNLFGGLMLVALIVKNHSNIVSFTASLVSVPAQQPAVTNGPSLAPAEPTQPDQTLPSGQVYNPNTGQVGGGGGHT